jgi:hypothetical protein
MGFSTHETCEYPYSYPLKTHTLEYKYGFLQVQVQVHPEIPQGYLWHSLVIVANISQKEGNLPLLHDVIVVNIAQNKAPSPLLCNPCNDGECVERKLWNVWKGNHGMWAMKYSHVSQHLPILQV